MRIIAIVVLAVLIGIATLLYGWWAVAVVAAAWGLVAGWRGASRAGVTAAIAAALSWGVLLAVDALDGRLGALGQLFGAIAKQPPVVFIVLTIVFPALLAWSAAALMASLWPRRDERDRKRHYVPADRVLARR